MTSSLTLIFLYYLGDFSSPALLNGQKDLVTRILGNKGLQREERLVPTLDFSFLLNFLLF